MDQIYCEIKHKAQNLTQAIIQEPFFTISSVRSLENKWQYIYIFFPINQKYSSEIRENDFHFRKSFSQPPDRLLLPLVLSSSREHFHLSRSRASSSGPLLQSLSVASSSRSGLQSCSFSRNLRLLRLVPRLQSSSPSAASRFYSRQQGREGRPLLFSLSVKFQIQVGFYSLISSPCLLIISWYELIIVVLGA